MKYTGVGSRETPEKYLTMMRSIGRRLSNFGYVLRSGGANGSDSAFAEHSKHNEIYIPWHGFNGHHGYHFIVPTESQFERAYELASTVHPAWDRLPDSHKKLHGRNCFQVLGLDLDDPSNFLICYTKNGAIIGGTATAIKLAVQHNVKVFNLHFDDNRDELLELIQSIEAA